MKNTVKTIRFKYVLGLLISSLFWPAFDINSASAATYYLDAANGDDSNLGTSDQPWKTLNRAYTWYSGVGSIVQEGDVVLFRDGDYGSFIENNVDRANWVTYKADTGHIPTLTGISLMYKVNKNVYLIFDGFNITDGISVKYISYMKVLNCTIQKEPAPISGYYEPYFVLGSAAVGTQYTNHITFQDNDISNAYRGMRIVDASDWIIKNNVIHRISEDGFSYPTGDNSVIEGNYIYDHRRFTTAMKINGTKTGTFVPGEVVTMPGTDATGIVYEYRNIYLKVYPTSQTTFYTYWWQDQSRYVVGQSSGATMNPIIDVDPPHTDGFQIHGSANNIIIKGNIIDRTRYVGPGSEDGQGLKLSGGSSYITLENNLVIASKPAIIMGSFDLYIYNNTIFGEGGVDLRPKWSDTIINEMYNNIIEKLNIIPNPPNTVGIVNHGNNIFGNYPSGGDDPYVLSIDILTELTNYPIDSLFIDAANHDFRLAEGSVAIDFGNAVYAPNSDVLGVSRVSPPDAGCYEYVSSEPANQINSLSTLFESLLDVLLDNTDQLTTDPNNYTISGLNEITIGQVSIDPNNHRVRLFTSPHSKNVNYTLTIAGVGSINYTYDSGLIGEWKLDEYSGTEAQDSSGFDNTATLVNGAKWTTDRDVSFDDDDDAVEIPIEDLQPDSGTVALWAYSENTSGVHYLFGHLAEAGDNAIKLYTIGGELVLNIGDAVATNIETLISQAWYNIALTWEETNCNIYVDGVRKPVVIIGDPTLTTLNTSADIGNDGNNRQLAFNGYIDNVHLYNRALSDTEISDLYYTLEVNENRVLALELEGVDDSGNPITYTAGGLPASASFDQDTNTFKWNPWYNQAGAYEITFEEQGQPQNAQAYNIIVYDVTPSSWYQLWLEHVNTL